MCCHRFMNYNILLRLTLVSTQICHFPIPSYIFPIALCSFNGSPMRFWAQPSFYLECSFSGVTPHYGVSSGKPSLFSLYKAATQFPQLDVISHHTSLAHSCFLQFYLQQQGHGYSLDVYQWMNKYENVSYGQNGIFASCK